MFDEVADFLQDKDKVLTSALAQNEICFLFKGNFSKIKRKLNDLNPSLEATDLNIVRAKHRIEALKKNFTLWKLQTAIHDFRSFSTLQFQTIDNNHLLHATI